MGLELTNVLTVSSVCGDTAVALPGTHQATPAVGGNNGYALGTPRAIDAGQDAHVLCWALADGAAWVLVTESARACSYILTKQA